MRQTKTAPRQSTRSPQPSKLRATAVDAAALAVSTALIIGMVGSLVFFLLIAFYRGQYDIRLMYIFGLYTVATVLIARIAIESGRSYANAFSLPLAVVSVLAIMRFVTLSGALAPLSWLINLGLLAIAWFLADRITFDCTLVSDRQRSHQQGLLQSLGLLKSDSRPAAEIPQTGDSQRKHNPGVWVLYFALLAFPLFGLGQLAIPDENQRNWAFAFLFSYLATALSLLVLTSLVGMRRYLRQRGVAMSTEMSLHWLTVGVGSVLVILLICLVLPLPGRSLGLIGLPAALQSPDGLGTSRWGWGDAGAQQQDEDEAAQAPQQPNAQQQAAQQAEPDPAAADGPPSPEGKGPPQANPHADPEAPAAASKNSSTPEGAGPSQAERTPSRPRNSSSQPAPDEQASANNSPQEDSPQEDSPQEDSPQEDSPQEDSPQGQPPVEKVPQEKPTDAAANDPQTPANTRPEDSEGKTNDPAPSGASASNPVSTLLSQFGSLGELFKWLTLLVLAAIVIIYIVTHPAEIARLWRELRKWFGALFGRRGGASPENLATPPKTLPTTMRRPFNSFSDPFTTSGASMTPAQVVEHSFAALEAWAAEHGAPRAEQQTATEFARQVTRSLPTLGPHALSAASMLDQVMFANWHPRTEDVQPLAQLWKSFTSPSRFAPRN